VVCLLAWVVEWAAAWAAWTIEAVSAETPNPFGAKPNESMHCDSRASKEARLFCFAFTGQKHLLKALQQSKLRDGYD
jgi:hypothetical protein